MTGNGLRSGTKPTKIGKHTKNFVVFVRFVALVPGRDAVARLRDRR